MTAISGLWLGSNLAPLVRGGPLPPPAAWAPPAVLLLCVVLLLGTMQLVRARLGAPMTPAARRRQQIVIAAALLVGVIAGVALGSA